MKNNKGKLKQAQYLHVAATRRSTARARCFWQRHGRLPSRRCLSFSQATVHCRRLRDFCRDSKALGAIFSRRCLNRFHNASIALRSGECFVCLRRGSQPASFIWNARNGSKSGTDKPTQTRQHHLFAIHTRHYLTSDSPRTTGYKVDIKLYRGLVKKISDLISPQHLNIVFRGKGVKEKLKLSFAWCCSPRTRIEVFKAKNGQLSISPVRQRNGPPP